MKKIISAAMTAAIACPLATNAQTKLDTTKVQNINEVVVKAVRAPKTSPIPLPRSLITSRMWCSIVMV